MSLFDHIENLRNKPDRTKQRIILIYSAVLTVIIVFLWLSLFNVPSLYKSDSVSLTSQAAVADGEESWFSSIISNIGRGVKEIRETITD